MSSPKMRLVTSAEKLSAAERRYFADLARIVDVIYEHAANVLEITWRELAVKADLSYITVEKLGNRETQFPRYQTIYKLAKAVGMNLVTESNNQKRTVRLAKAG